MANFYEDKELKRLQKAEMGILKDFMKVCKENHLNYFAFAGTGIGAIRHQGFIPWDDDIDVALPRKDYEKALKIFEEQYSDKYFVMNAEHDERYPLMTTRISIKGTKFIEVPFKELECNLGIFLDVYAYDNLADDAFLYNMQIWTAWFWSKLLILRILPNPVISTIDGWKAGLIKGICVIVHKFLAGIHLSPEWIYKKAKNACTKYNHKKTKRIGFPCDTDPNWNTMLKTDVFPVSYWKFEDVELAFPKDMKVMLEHFYGDTYMQLPPEEKRKTHFPYILDFGQEE